MGCSGRELEAARRNLTVVRDMQTNRPRPYAHRQFLISFKRGQPDWALLGVPGVNELPAVRWRQRNLDQLAPEIRAKAHLELETVLFPSHASGSSGS